jgi:hypothetical protein
MKRLYRPPVELNSQAAVGLSVLLRHNAVNFQNEFLSYHTLCPYGYGVELGTGVLVGV